MTSPLPPTLYPSQRERFRSLMQSAARLRRLRDRISDPLVVEAVGSTLVRR